MLGFLDTLKIKLFQSHEHTVLKLSPGINVIQGKSCVGKTSILRAIDWVTFFRPLGFKFRSRFAKDKYAPTEVEMIFTDGNKVSVSKQGLASAQAMYTVNGAEYQGFGTEVPIEAKAAINLTEINFQRQLDPYFLMSNSPGEVAKQINQIIKVEESDAWGKALTKQINSFSKEVEASKVQAGEIATQITTLDYIPALAEKLDDAATQDAIIQSTWTRIESGGEAIQRLKSVQKRKAIVGAFLEVIRSLQAVERLAHSIKSLSRQIELFSKLIIIRRNKAVDAEFIDFVSEKLLLTNESQEQYKEYKNKITKLNRILQSLRTTKEELVRRELKLHKAQNKLRKNVESREVCPWCGTLLTVDLISDILEGV